MRAIEPARSAVGFGIPLFSAAIRTSVGIRTGAGAMTVEDRLTQPHLSLCVGMAGTGELLNQRRRRAVPARLRQPVLTRVARRAGGDDTRADDPDSLSRAHQRRGRAQCVDQRVTRER